MSCPVQINMRINEHLVVHIQQFNFISLNKFSLSLKQVFKLQFFKLVCKFDILLKY